jgi:hypothetical protein
MRRSEITGGVLDTQSGQGIDNVWIAARDDEPENKGVSVVPLPRLAREIIYAMPIIDAANPRHQHFVFLA